MTVVMLVVDFLADFIVQVLVHNVMQISRSDETRQAHAFSLYLMQPLVATSLGLLAFNWWVMVFIVINCLFFK